LHFGKVAFEKILLFGFALEASAGRSTPIKFFFFLIFGETLKNSSKYRNVF